MKVLIVNTPLFQKYSESYDEDSLPPYGLGYIATNLQNNNINVELLDAINQKLNFNELKARIEFLTPDFLALNIFTTNYELVKDLINSLKIKTNIIIGGLATKSLYNNILNWNTKNHIDIVIGDGELITKDIVTNSIREKCYIEDKNLKRRVFRIDKESVYYAKDISNTLLNRKFFLNEPVRNVYNTLEINLITSRGCIYDCSFCAAARSQNSEYGVRERTSVSIENELKDISIKYPEVSSIRILDDLFLTSKSTIQKATKLFSKFDFTWRSMAHVRTFTNIEQEYLSELRKSGCIELFIGIESGSSRILKSMNKTTDINLIRETISKLFKAKINVKGYFIFGFPGETKHDAEKTYNLALELNKLSINFAAKFRTSVFQFRTYHGTEIYEQLIYVHPNFNKQQVSQNKELSKLIGREQFNFHTNNYSKISMEIKLFTTN
jgi:anaerobic magnesium-protoporphyrin IX monomethyl ester cyclase